MKLGRITCAAVCLATLTLIPAQSGRLTLTASSSASCEPAPASFAVPDGQRGASFRLIALTPGKPCTGNGDSLSGFSIRRGGETVFVYYPGPGGPVSDPLPLENLSLPPGRYVLLSAPAKGASVRLSLEIAPPA